MTAAAKKIINCKCCNPTTKCPVELRATARCELLDGTFCTDCHPTALVPWDCNGKNTIRSNTEDEILIYPIEVVEIPYGGSQFFWTQWPLEYTNDNGDVFFFKHQTISWSPLPDDSTWSTDPETQGFSRRLSIPSPWTLIDADQAAFLRIHAEYTQIMYGLGSCFPCHDSMFATLDATNVGGISAAALEIANSCILTYTTPCRGDYVSDNEMTTHGSVYHFNSNFLMSFGEGPGYPELITPVYSILLHDTTGETGTYFVGGGLGNEINNSCEDAKIFVNNTFTFGSWGGVYGSGSIDVTFRWI